MVKKYMDYRMRLRNIRVYIYDPTKEQIENLKLFDCEFLCYRQEKMGTMIELAGVIRLRRNQRTYAKMLKEQIGLPHSKIRFKRTEKNVCLIAEDMKRMGIEFAKGDLPKRPKHPTPLYHAFRASKKEDDVSPSRID